MVQRRVDLLQDVAVDLCIDAVDLQNDILVQLTRDIAHHAREAPRHIAERPHAAGQHFAVQAVAEIVQAAVIFIEFIEPVGQVVSAAIGLGVNLPDQCLAVFVTAIGIKAVVEAIEQCDDFSLAVFDLLQRVCKRVQPA